MNSELSQGDTMKIKKLVVAGDFHVPYHDPVLLDLFLEFLTDFQPDILVINGDFLDCFAISRFDKVPHHDSLKNEIEIGKVILTRIRKAIPDAEIYMVEGNHEFRLRQYLIKNAQELYELSPTLADYLKLEEFGVEWVGTKATASKWIDTYKRFGQLYVGHWDRVNKHSAMTAKNLVTDKGVSLVQNHCHRIGQYNFRREDDIQIVGIEAGCMCDLNPNYTSKPNWQQGFVVAYLDQDGSGRFHHTIIQVLGYKFFHNGKIYEIQKTKPVRKLKVEMV